MNAVLMLLGVLIGYFVIRFIYIKKWNKNLDFSVSFEKDHVVAGDMVNLKEVVTNAKRLPLPFVHIKFQMDRKIEFQNKDANSSVSDNVYRDDVFSLLFNQRITRRIPVTCTKRGVFTIDEVECISSGAFMSDILLMRKKCNSLITVYPKTVDMSEFQLMNNRICGDLERKKYLLEDKFVFRGIRDYEPFDNMKDINFKASAKMGHLMVNEFNETMSEKVCVLLNLENDGMLKFDRLSEESISIAAGLCESLIERGINVSLISNGRDIDGESLSNSGFGSDVTHLNSINTSLARIDLDNEAVDFADLLSGIFLNEDMSDLSNESGDLVKWTEDGESDTVYVMISASRRERLQNVFERLTKGQTETVWVVPHHPGMDYELSYCNIIPRPWEVRNDK